MKVYVTVICSFINIIIALFFKTLITFFSNNEKGRKTIIIPIGAVSVNI